MDTKSIKFERKKIHKDSRRCEDYQGTGAKLNYPHRLPSNRARPTPVVEFALVYSNCCGKVKPNVPLPHFSLDITPSYFPAFCGMMGHAKITHALASFFVLCTLATLSFWLLGSRKSIALPFEVKTSNVNCVTRI